MFEKLVQRLSGARNHDSLTRWSREFIEASIPKERESEDRDLRFFQKRPDALEEWFAIFSESLGDIAREPTPRKQLLAIRSSLIKEVEASCRAMCLMNAELSEEDRRTLLAKFCPGESQRDALTLQYQVHVFADASCRCLRALGAQYGDTVKNDWYIFYIEAYNELFQQICAATIKKERGEVLAIEPAFITVLKQTVDNIKKGALAGQNWKYTPGMLHSTPEEARTEALLHSLDS